MNQRVKEHYEEVMKEDYFILFRKVYPEEANGIYYTAKELEAKYGAISDRWANKQRPFQDVFIETAIIHVDKIIQDAIDAFKNPKTKKLFIKTMIGQGAVLLHHDWLRETHGLGVKHHGEGVTFERKAPIDNNVIQLQVLKDLKYRIMYRCTMWMDKTFHLHNTRFGSTIQAARRDNVVLMAKKLGMKELPKFNEYMYDAVTKGHTITEFDVAGWLKFKYPKFTDKQIKMYVKEINAWWKGIKEIQKPE